MSRELPVPHSYVGFIFGGRISGGSSYDPSDFGDPMDESVWLPATDICATSDPTATPALLPKKEAGVWLHIWEMGCETTRPDGNPYGVRGEFLAGAVAGCETHADGVDAPPLDAGEVVMWNPDDDLARLGIAWLGPSCSDGATVSLHPTLTHYSVHVITTRVGCPEVPMTPYSVLFYLADPVDASNVDSDVVHVDG